MCLNCNVNVQDGGEAGLIGGILKAGKRAQRHLGGATGSQECVPWSRWRPRTEEKSLNFFQDQTIFSAGGAF